MEKRLLLALVLTGLVVVGSQFLFPTRRPPRPTTPIAADTTLRDTTVRDTVANRPPSLAEQPPAAAPTVTAQTPGRPDTGVAQAAPVRPETVTVADSLAEYRFTNVGGSLVSAVLKRYRALDGTTRPVVLHAPGAPLLRYRLVAPGDTIRLDRTPFTMTRRDSTTVEYATTLPNAEVLIRYAFVPDSYLVRVNGTVKGGPSGAYLLIDMPGGLRSPEADSLDDQRNLAFALKPRAQSAKGIPFSKLEPGERRIEPGPLTWAAEKNKYFILGVLAPTGGPEFAELIAVGGARTSRTPSIAHATVVEPVANGAFSFEVYAGPQEWKRMVALGRDFENSNPYGGWLQGVVQPFATIVMRVLLWMHTKLNLSYGWVLVIFGIAVRIVLWPLNQTAMRTNIKMQRIQPELADIQKRYKSDPTKMQAEIMRVYKEHGMSPFSALSGCLPMLLPMPVLFALFFVFQNTIEFRGVPFLWLHDISLKDPYYILPLLMGASMFVLSWIGMRSAPPNPQTKMMTYVFPAMMTFFLLNFASGLNLYYTIQNLASLPQQWLIAAERAKGKA